jgi:hypothetical protein
MYISTCSLARCKYNRRCLDTWFGCFRSSRVLHMSFECTSCHPNLLICNRMNSHLYKHTQIYVPYIHAYAYTCTRTYKRIRIFDLICVHFFSFRRPYKIPLLNSEKLQPGNLYVLLSVHNYRNVDGKHELYRQWLTSIIKYCRGTLQYIGYTWGTMIFGSWI